MNPLLFMPSPRDIPAVKKLWHDIPYDKFIVKYKRELEAYNEAQDFFLKHMEYTHIIICPDDAEISKDNIQILIDDVDKYGFKTISGVMNLDESNLNTYAMQNNCNFTLEIPTGKGAWIEKLPKEVIFRVDHSGFQCQVINRYIMNLIRFEEGHLDWQISRLCKKLGISIFVDQRVRIYHRRNEQRQQVKMVNNTEEDIGYSYWIHDRT